MTNFLNLSCPNCGDEDQIDIVAHLWVRITEDGTDADASRNGSHIWGEKHPFMCGACEFVGQVRELRPVQDKKEAPASSAD